MHVSVCVCVCVCHRNSGINNKGRFVLMDSLIVHDTAIIRHKSVVFLPSKDIHVFKCTQVSRKGV